MCTQNAFRDTPLSRWKTKYFSVAKGVIQRAVHVTVLQNWRIISDICTELGK